MTNYDGMRADARKRLEAAPVSAPPFDTHPACRLPWEGKECGRRDPHRHWSPVMADYPGFDPT